MESLVSIIIPCYNGERFLKQCVLSCLKQTYKHLEIILVDDCSTDSSREIMKRLKGGCDTRIIWTSTEKNSGTAIARNTGIAYATGRYLAFLDCDDMLTQDSIEVRMKHFTEPIGIVAGYSYVIRGDVPFGKAVKFTDKYQIKEGKTVSSPTGMIRTELVQRYGCFNPSLPLNEDREFWGRMLNKHKIPAIKIARPVAFYRIHPESKMRAASQKVHERETKRCTELLGDYPDKTKWSDEIRIVNFENIK